MIERNLSLKFLLTLFIGGLITTAITCCTVGPNFLKPTPRMPEKWAEAPTEETRVKSIDISQWWTIFGDPQLNSLVERAVQSNLDLQIAEARVREARAQRVVVASAAYPEIDAGGLYSRSSHQ